MLAEEGLQLSADRVVDAVRSADGDARLLLNILQTGFTGSSDKERPTLECTFRLLFPRVPVTTQMIVDATDTDTLGTTSTFFENYLTSKATPETEVVRPREAELLAEADIVESKLFHKQDWALLPYVGLIGCAPALNCQPSVCVMPKKLSRRSDESKGSDPSLLFHGSTRSKTALISTKAKQLAELRSRMLLEGHADASLDRVGYLSTALLRALHSENGNTSERVMELLRSTGVSASTAECLIRTVGLRPLRARDKGMLKRCAGTLRESS